VNPPTLEDLQDEEKAKIKKSFSFCHFPSDFYCTLPLFSLKVLTNEKRSGLKLVSIEGLALSYSRREFYQNLFRPHPKTAQQTLVLLFEYNDSLQTHDIKIGLRHSFQTILFSETAVL